MATTKKTMKMMPNSFDAEQSLLGAMLLNNEVGYEVLPKVKASDFYYEPHQLIYEAMAHLHNSGMPIDIVTLSDRLEGQNLLSKTGGVSYLNELTAALPSAANFGFYLDIVERDGILRKIISNSQKIIENTYNTNDSSLALAYAEKLMFDIGKERETSTLSHVQNAAMEVMKKFEGIMQDAGSNRGLMTGFRNLDNITNGFLPGQLIVLAARPGCGKTSYAMNIVGNLAVREPERKIAVFSLEMSVNELTQRLLCNLAAVPMSKVLKGKESPEEFNKLWLAKRNLDASNVYIDDSALITPEEIMSKCRRLAQQKNGLDLIVIDYLQLMGSQKQRDNKQQEVSEISRSMKILAKELKVPVLLLSQMSRAIEKRDDKTPKLSDLRESGAIEQDADMVYFLNRDDKKETLQSPVKLIELIIAKHRNGPCDTIYYNFNGDCVRFEQVEKVFAFAKKKENTETAIEAGSGTQEPPAEAPVFDTPEFTEAPATLDEIDAKDYQKLFADLQQAELPQAPQKDPEEE